MNSEDQPPTGTPPRIARLSDEDAAAVDRLFEDGHRGDPAGPDDPRAEAVSSLFGLLDSYPVEPASEDLVNATLARVAREEAARADRMAIQNVPRVATRSLRLPDFFAVAAALFLAVGIGWPLYSVIQDQNQIIESRHRLGRVGEAIAGFALDHDDMLPLDEKLLEGDGVVPCPLTGDHGRHLDVLVDQAYLDADYLYVQQGDRKKRLVAYRVPFSRATFRFADHHRDEILLSDPNPVIRAHREGHGAVDPTAGSHVHDFDVIVVMNFGMQIETLDSALLPDGDVLWVGRDYDPDGPSRPIRPVDVHDEILAH